MGTMDQTAVTLSSGHTRRISEAVLIDSVEAPKASGIVRIMQRSYKRRCDI